MNEVWRPVRKDIEGLKPDPAPAAVRAHRLFCLAFAAIFLIPLTSSANAQTMAALARPAPFGSTAEIEPSREYAFSIAPLPLDNALDLYRKTTGIKLFYDSQLVSDRRSSGVVGRYSADEALSALLANTNLYFVRTAHDIVTLVPMTIAPLEASAASSPAKLTLQTLHVEAPSRAMYEVNHYIYGSIVEGAIRGALQQERSLKEHRYSADILIWVSRGGSLQHFQLANSTGNPSVDNKIEHVLGKVVIQEAPPTDLPQPLHVRIRMNS